jgi:hypothetical protein
MPTPAPVPAPSWILLSSRLPREPSRLRLAAWRRLKRLGAVLLHDAIWVLPDDPRTREAFEWLAQEVEEQGGSALLWEAGGLSQAQDRRLVEQFRREADARYTEIAHSARAIRDATLRGRRRGARLRPPPLDTLTHALRQLRGLERALRAERRRDYFRAPARVNASTVVDAAVAELRRWCSTSPKEAAARALGD